MLDIAQGEWNGKPRVVFICEESLNIGSAWEGEGTGEKGYGY